MTGSAAGCAQVSQLCVKHSLPHSKDFRTNQLARKGIMADVPVLFIYVLWLYLGLPGNSLSARSSASPQHPIRRTRNGAPLYVAKAQNHQPLTPALAISSALRAQRRSAWNFPGARCKLTVDQDRRLMHWLGFSAVALRLTASQATVVK
jgi:hypothetical protein